MNVSLRIGLFLALYSIEGIYQLFVNDLDLFPLNYFFAAFTGGLTFWLLSAFGKSRIVRGVKAIQIVWMVLHAIGFVMYMCYLPPDVYNVSQYVLHIIQLLWLIFARNDLQRRGLYHHRDSQLFNANTRLRRVNFEG